MIYAREAPGRKRESINFGTCEAPAWTIMVRYCLTAPA